MFVLDFFYGVLNYFGLYQKNAKILFLGLDNAGKTTLLHLLTNDKLMQHIPTAHPGQEELVVGNVRFKAFDLGGHEAARRIWTNYFQQVDAIVYIVDSADRERFPEAKKELDGLLSQEALSTVPFLILGNKIDVRNAASEPELRSVLGLAMTTGKDVTSIAKDSGSRAVELFMCSVTRKIGYGDGLKWLTNFIQ